MPKRCSTGPTGKDREDARGAPDGTPGNRDLGIDDMDADLRAGPDDMDADLRIAPEDAATDGALDAPLTDELDLHTFLPRDCADVVAEYVRAAQEAGMTAVRIVHGKGTGTLRRIVHSVLATHPAVRAYRLADERSGSWGATLVDLHVPAECKPRTKP